MHMLKTKVMSVDKTMAELLLGYEKTPEVGVSGTNRRANWELVKGYARLMADGFWRLTHQGIAFKGFLDNDTAVLADGGHRLRAVIEADKAKPGIAIDFMVTEGLTEEDVLAMDVGRKRTPGDFFTMSGETNTRLLASVTRLAWLYDHPDSAQIEGGGRRNLVASPQELQDYLDKHPLLRDAVLEGVKVAKHMRPTAAGAGWFLAVDNGHTVKDANEFVDGLRHGNNLPEGSAIHVLRELMRNSERIGRVYDPAEQLALFIKAYLKWHHGAYTKQLMWRRDEPFPRF